MLKGRYVEGIRQATRKHGDLWVELSNLGLVKNEGASVVIKVLCNKGGRFKLQTKDGRTASVTKSWFEDEDLQVEHCYRVGQNYWEHEIHIIDFLGRKKP